VGHNNEEVHVSESSLETTTAGMTAPPSTAYKIVDTPQLYKDVIERYGVQGSFVGGSEVDSPWVPFGDNAAIRHLAFDVRRNAFSNILWIKSSGVVGTHNHRGTVVMLCLEGSARYLEYDWVAEPGSFIYETPGLSHTLVTDHPDGVKLFGWLEGPIDFFDEQGNFIETLDVWWYINHYESYCKEHGIPINPQLYL
jgi:2,4'-dihydroxyacetophenone dioxygenase